MKDQHAESFQKLDNIEKRIADAIIEQNDVFAVLHKHFHDDTQKSIKREHDKTRQVIIDVSEKMIQGI
jgi:hypothetical protein